MITITKFKIWSDIIATWVTIIGVFIGGSFALVEYYDKTMGERVKATIDYVDRFNKDPIHNSRVALNEFWNKRSDLVVREKPISDKDLKEFIVTTIRENKIEKDTNVLINFFENLNTCVCAKLCDEETAKRFFGKYSLEFYGLNFPYLSKQRELFMDKSFGIGVETLAKSYKTGEPVSNVYSKLNQKIQRKDYSRR